MQVVQYFDKCKVKRLPIGEKVKTITRRVISIYKYHSKIFSYLRRK